ncbi:MULTISPECIES: DUF6286 domain-containing Asp23/Gls24 family envelope stress response protein [unclassified Streptomyces]|uniref:DUF6286 domain-containing Asp23/Gls24 family envelope stress response protein n=1 Tax=unclassified Streptomyces TaxID=2593676 RepID=UPI002E2FDB89|nr:MULTISPECIES: DUF6286 domain-containing Asp23/Gls24 family envelope stress response protein [unclassified Streptomyces]
MSVPAARPGTTTVSDKAVRRIAERAASEALPGRPVTASRVSAAVHGRRADVALGVSLPYPLPVAETAREVRRHVSERTRELTGLDVSLRRISVDTLTVPSGTTAPDGMPPLPTPSVSAPFSPALSASTPSVSASSVSAPRSEGGDRRAPRRRWSRRRVPMTAVMLMGAVSFGAVALDMIRVRVAHRPAAAWRTGTLNWLTGHGPGDTQVVLAGGGLALLGLWLTVLAVTPGRRRLLTLSAPGTSLDAAADRSAVAASVRDAVADVPGIGPVAVRVRRCRVVVRAGLVFGDRGTAHDEVAAATRRVLGGWRPRLAPRVRIMVRTEPLWRPPRPEAEGPPTAPVTPAHTPGEEDEG